MRKTQHKCARCGRQFYPNRILAWDDPSRDYCPKCTERMAFARGAGLSLETPEEPVAAARHRCYERGGGAGA